MASMRHEVRLLQLLAKMLTSLRPCDRMDTELIVIECSAFYNIKAPPNFCCNKFLSGATPHEEMCYN